MPGVASVIGLVWSGYWLFQTMELVFNHFYGAADRGFGQQVVMAVAMIGLRGPVHPVDPGVDRRQLPGRHLGAGRPLNLTRIDPLIGLLVALGSAVGMFVAIYRVTLNTPADPGRRLAGGAAGQRAVRAAEPGVPALLPGILWGSYAAYKTLGLFLMLMTWFYCLAVIVVLGVELSAFLSGRRGAEVTQVAAMQALIAAPWGGTIDHGRGRGRRAAPRRLHRQRRPAQPRVDTSQDGGGDGAVA